MFLSVIISFKNCPESGSYYLQDTSCFISADYFKKVEFFVISVMFIQIYDHKNHQNRKNQEQSVECKQI